MSKKNDGYDWLNDPFDEKKAAAEREQAHMGGGVKLGIGCGCLVVILLVLVCCVLAFAALVGVG